MQDLQTRMQFDHRPSPHFDGETYSPAYDLTRLTTQIGRVYDALRSGRWMTLSELREETGAPEASISARIRDLRKKRFGGLQVPRRRRGDPKRGVWEYRLEPESDSSQWHPPEGDPR